MVEPVWEVGKMAFSLAKDTALEEEEATGVVSNRIEHHPHRQLYSFRAKRLIS